MACSIDVGARVDGQDQVDDVLEPGIERMRPVPAAPADVVADAVLGNPAQRVVERAHAQVGPAPVVVPRLPARHHRVRLVHHHGVVDLHQQAGVDDRLVLLVQRVGEREHELLLAGVVLVLEPVRAGRRDHRQEAVDAVVLVPGEGRLEVGDVTVERGAVVGQRAGAHPRHARAGGRGLLVGQRARGGGVALADGGLVERVDRGIGAGERLAVAARREHARALELDRAHLEAADPLVQVGDPAGLAHLAVVDDVDPDLDLLSDDVDRRPLRRHSGRPPRRSPAPAPWPRETPTAPAAGSGSRCGSQGFGPCPLLLPGMALYL